MNTTQTKRLVIVGELLLGSLIAAMVTIVIFRSHKLLDNCEPMSSMPALDLANLKNVASHDNRALIGLAGHLKFISMQLNGEERWSFRRIDIGTVTLSPGERGGQKLVLGSNCSEVTLNLRRYGQIVMIDTIQVDPKGVSSTLSCSTGPTGIYFGQDNSYHCYSNQVLSCYKRVPTSPRLACSKNENGAELVMEVVLGVLRLEVNGNEEKISTGNFSKPAQFCF